LDLGFRRRVLDDDPVKKRSFVAGAILPDIDRLSRMSVMAANWALAQIGYPKNGGFLALVGNLAS
jgi:hypothetical protein